MVGRLMSSLLWVLALVMSTMADPRPSYSGYRRPAAPATDDRLLEALRARRNHQCTNVYGTCFSSAQCCAGLVCASNDDNIEMKPETPGYCVKEKDLQVCEDSSDCPTGTRCQPLGRSSEFYCAPQRRPNTAPASSVPVVSEPVQATSRKFGLGDPCQSTAECAPFHPTDSSPMCCQDVTRHRMKPRRQCDRVREGISVCVE